MAALEAIATATIVNLVRRAGGEILARVAKSGHVGEVINELARATGALADAKGIETFARENPADFAAAVQSVEKAAAARWAALLAETNHASIFVAGARPAALWACILILVYSGFVVPVINWLFQLLGYVASRTDLPALQHPPDVAWNTLVWLIPLLYGIRASEGVFGVKRGSL